MTALVSIPYQPGYKATPDTVARLMRACAIAGHNILLDDAWRSYAEQKYYWDAYLAGWGNDASNPDTGERSHMRGAAFDIVNSGDRSAMLAAGFLPQSVEWWHFYQPGWQNMPIIMTDDGAAYAGAGATLLEEDDMPDMNTILNTAAFDGGPTVSEMFVEIHNIYQGLYSGGPAVPGGGSIVNLIDSIPARVWATTVQRGDQQIPALQELADAKTMIARVPGADAGK